MLFGEGLLHKFFYPRSQVCHRGRIIIVHVILAFALALGISRFILLLITWEEYIEVLVPVSFYSMCYEVGPVTPYHRALCGVLMVMGSRPAQTILSNSLLTLLAVLPVDSQLGLYPSGLVTGYSPSVTSRVQRSWAIGQRRLCPRRAIIHGGYPCTAPERA